MYFSKNSVELLSGIMLIFYNQTARDINLLYIVYHAKKYCLK